MEQWEVPLEPTARITALAQLLNNWPYVVTSGCTWIRYLIGADVKVAQPRTSGLSIIVDGANHLAGDDAHLVVAPNGAIRLLEADDSVLFELQPKQGLEVTEISAAAQAFNIEHPRPKPVIYMA